MNMALTKDSLGIFWEGEERNGIILYAIWCNSLPELPMAVNQLLSGLEYKTHKMIGENWYVWMWDILIKDWPSDSSWPMFIESLFDALLKNDALLAWCGLEGGFVEPPNLFSVEEMSGCVWAAKLSNGVYFKGPGLYESFCTISNEDMFVLQNTLNYEASRGGA